MFPERTGTKLFEKICKTDKPLPKLTKKEGTQIDIIREKKEEDIMSGTTEIHGLLGNFLKTYFSELGNLE